MGIQSPFSITTKYNKMKALIAFAAVCAVSFADPEAKAAVAPYYYGVPGYGLPYVNNYVNYAPATYASLPATYAPAYTVAAPATYTVAAPAPVAAAPVVAAAPAIVPAPSVASQFAAQDEFGNTQYGYQNLNSAKHEVGNALTGVSGQYQYVDANGVLQTVQYVADALGFRTADSRLPVHDAALPVAPVHDAELPVAPVYNGVAPAPVEDTPEVAAAKAEFLAKFDEVASRSKRESDPALIYGYNSPYIVNPRYQNFYYNGIYAYNHLAYANHPNFAYGFYAY